MGNIAVKAYERMKIMDISLHDVSIELNGKHTRLKAMLDTGNRLIEPIDKSSVILTEYRALSQILPDKLINLYEQKRESCLMELIEALGEESLRYSLRLVPYSSLGKKNGLLLGFCADKVAVDGVELSSVVIGIYSSTISNGDYSALVSPEHIGGAKWTSKII
jgi:stage II sporulation protein GA (sporulation sigma-E factor processing peptidase)